MSDPATLSQQARDMLTDAYEALDSLTARGQISLEARLAIGLGFNGLLTHMAAQGEVIGESIRRFGVLLDVVRQQLDQQQEQHNQVQQLQADVRQLDHTVKTRLPSPDQN